MTAHEVQPLSAFRLGWRFTRERNSFSAADALARLRPLTRDGARLVADEAAQRCSNEGTGTIAFRSDEPPGSVLERLRALPVRAETSIMVSWDGDTALETDWESFVSHWGDFCYPASDDVTVWSPTGDWTLCYRRYEVFQFRGALQAAAAASLTVASESQVRPIEE